MGKKKSKLVLKIVAALFPLLFTLLIVVLVVYMGYMAAISVKNTVAGFFGITSDKEAAEEYEEMITLAEVSAEQMLVYVSDKKVVTDEMLEGWMIERSSMKRLLKAVIEYNSREETVRIHLPYKYDTWQHYRKKVVTTTVDEEGNEVTKETYVDAYKYVPAVDYYYGNDWKSTEIAVLKETVRDRYRIDWQLVYLLCVYGRMDSDEYITEIRDGETEQVKLSNRYIDSVIEDLKPRFTYLYDITALDSRPEVDDVIGTGSYKTLYTEDTSYGGKGGFRRKWHYWPVSRITRVETLISEDTPVYRENELVSWECAYDVSGFSRLVADYCNGRGEQVVLMVLDALPGGKTIADNIRIAAAVCGEGW